MCRFHASVILVIHDDDRRLAAREALATGVPTVILADSRRSEPIRAALAGRGTVIGDGLKIEDYRLKIEDHRPQVERVQVAS